MSKHETRPNQRYTYNVRSHSMTTTRGWVTRGANEIIIIIENANKSQATMNERLDTKQSEPNQPTEKKHTTNLFWFRFDACACIDKYLYSCKCVLLCIHKIHIYRPISSWHSFIISSAITIDLYDGAGVPFNWKSIECKWRYTCDIRSRIFISATEDWFAVCGRVFVYFKSHLLS